MEEKMERILIKVVFRGNDVPHAKLSPDCIAHLLLKNPKMK